MTDKIPRKVKIKKTAIRYCKEVYGFGEYKQVAISLLEETFKFSQKFNLDPFLISGTLLGQVRHNDFIPWDDDIDLLARREIFARLPKIKKQYPHLHFICADYMAYLKVSFKDKGYKIPGTGEMKWDFSLHKLVENRWPFIDVFTFSKKENFVFYNKTWDESQFFPLKNVNFLGIDVAIPANPDHFLRSNYGENYMTNFLNDGHSHKTENIIDSPKIVDP